MAIAGRPVQQSLLNKEEILKRISVYDIYRYYFGPFRVNKLCINHLRGEKNGSFIIGAKKGELRHKDYGDSYWQGDAFNLVQQIYNTSFHDALAIIDKDFGLGLAQNNTVIVKPKVIEWEQPKIEVVPPPNFIVQTRKFTKEELSYWKDYEIGLEDLKRHHVYAPKQIWRNRRRLPMGNLLTFAFFDPENEKWKIYRPHGKKGKEGKINERKWDTNFEWNYCENLSNLDYTKPIYIQKSRKDRLVMEKILETTNIISVQAEDISCLPSINGDITVFGDNDKKGFDYTKAVRENFGWKTINPPQEFLPITDFADLVKEKGLDFVKNLLKQIQNEQKN